MDETKNATQGKGGLGSKLGGPNLKKQTHIVKNEGRDTFGQVRGSGGNSKKKITGKKGKKKFSNSSHTEVTKRQNGSRHGRGELKKKKITYQKIQAGPR